MCLQLSECNFQINFAIMQMTLADSANDISGTANNIMSDDAMPMISQFSHASSAALLASY